MTNSLRHVKAAPALAMSCALPASRCCCGVSFGGVGAVIEHESLTPGVPAGTCPLY